LKLPVRSMAQCVFLFPKRFPPPSKQDKARNHQKKDDRETYKNKEVYSKRFPTIANPICERHGVKLTPVGPTRMEPRKLICEFVNRFNQPECECGDCGGGGNCQNPSPEYPPGNSPFDSGQASSRAHAHDGSGDCVSS